MIPSRMLLTTLVLAVATTAPATVAQGATRAPIKDCGDISTLDGSSGAFVGAITAQGGTCKNARSITASVARSAGCKAKGFCRVRTYNCLLGKVGKELTLVRCTNSRQTAFVRFEFGS